MRYKLITTPNEVIRAIANRKCPICKGKLNVDGIDTIDMEEYIYSYTNCLSIEDHYDIELEYQDPRCFDRIIQDLTLYDGEMRYNITQSNNGDQVSTVIEAYDIGMEDYSHIITFPDRVFNLSRFSAAKAMQEIKTLMVFS